jgi:hypothetical protein
LQVIDLIGRLRRVDYLKEHNAVDLDHRVVAADHFLVGNIHYGFAHVHFRADLADDRIDKVQTRRQRVGIFAESLHRVFHALRHRLVTGDHEHHQNPAAPDREYTPKIKWHLFTPFDERSE